NAGNVFGGGTRQQRKPPQRIGPFFGSQPLEHPSYALGIEHRLRSLHARPRSREAETNFPAIRGISITADPAPSDEPIHRDAHCRRGNSLVLREVFERDALVGIEMIENAGESLAQDLARFWFTPMPYVAGEVDARVSREDLLHVIHRRFCGAFNLVSQIK